MIIKKKYVISFIIALLISSFTANFSKNLIDGDITKYVKVYNFTSFSEAEKRYTVSQDPSIDIWGNTDQTDRDYYSKHLTSREITHFVTISFFSKFLSYYQYLAVLNFFLIFLIFVLLIKNNANFLITLTLLFTNYYMIILYFGAERLKVGLIFGLIALIFYDNKKLSYSNLIISVMSHFQLIIFYVAIFFNYIIRSIIKIFSHKIISLFFLFLLLSFIIILLVANNHIIYKINQQILTLNDIIIGWIKITIFFILTYINFKKFSFLLFLFLPFYFATIIVGSDRYIILVFAIFFYFSIKKNRGVNFPLIVVLTYFSFKTILVIFPLVNCNTLNMDVEECKITLYKAERTKRINANKFLIKKYN